MVIFSFKDKSFREGISPVLADMLSPLIGKTVYVALITAVKAAIEGLKSSVTEGMNKSNKDLQDTVTKQNKIIENQKSINEQKIMLDSNLSTTEDLQCNGHLLAAEVDQPRFSHNELEQYRRRNSLRINNFVLDTPVENEHELTRRVLYFLNFLYTAGLKGVCRVLDERDIERCHFVGKPKDSGPQKILIKFSCYHDKWRVFSLKKNLKKHPHKNLHYWGLDIHEPLSCPNVAASEERR